jgi:hypothetical protein
LCPINKDFHSYDGRTTILFKRTERIKYGIILEEDDGERLIFLCVFRVNPRSSKISGRSKAENVSPLKLSVNPMHQPFTEHHC